MKLNTGAKMADGKYKKKYVAGSADREYTVLISQKQLTFLDTEEIDLITDI
jgi:hypothetical protein